MKTIREIIKRIMPDKWFLQIVYYRVFNRKLDLKAPKYYSEKLQWMKLYDRNPLYTYVVDKDSAKEYISNLIGDEYIIPTIGKWKSAEEIDFDALPNQFVLKCTHDCGGIVIVKDKRNIDKESIMNKLNSRLNRNYYLKEREWPYKNIVPQIIAENYIDESGELNLGILNDYKFYCFEGKIDCVMVCLERYKHAHPIFVFYDLNWNRLYYLKEEPNEQYSVCKPDNFDKMIEIVTKISSCFKCVRVDLYNVNGKILFGELTFFNQGGFDIDISEETDKYWGSLFSID